MMKIECLYWVLFMALPVLGSDLNLAQQEENTERLVDLHRGFLSLSDLELLRRHLRGMGSPKIHHGSEEKTRPFARSLYDGGMMHHGDADDDESPVDDDDWMKDNDHGNGRHGHHYMDGDDYEGGRDNDEDTRNVDLPVSSSFRCNHRGWEGMHMYRNDCLVMKNQSYEETDWNRQWHHNRWMNHSGWNFTYCCDENSTWRPDATNGTHNNQTWTRNHMRCPMHEGGMRNCTQCNWTSPCHKYNMTGLSADRCDGLTPEEHWRIMLLFHSTNTIHREVNPIPGGVETVTTSENSQIAQTIQQHVADMQRHRLVRGWDPLFHGLYEHHEDINFNAVNLSNGVHVIYTGSTPCASDLVSEHAKTLSAFVNDGMPEMRKSHQLPDSCSNPTSITKTNDSTLNNSSSTVIGTGFTQVVLLVAGMSLMATLTRGMII